jgi:hypothetical protein
VVASWQDSCPVEGVCSECGLRFRWGEALNPAMTTPRWSFEHGRARLAPRLVSTAVRALAARSFWNRIRLEHEIRVYRLVIVARALGCVVHLAYGAAHAWSVHLTASNLGLWWQARGVAAEPSWRPALRAALWPYQACWVGRGWGATAVPPPVRPGEWLVLGAFLSAPLVLLLLPQSFRRARIRRLHVVRGGVYSLVGAALAGVGGAGVAISRASEQWSAGAPGIMWWQPAEGAIALLCGLWLCVYWQAFVRRYLKLDLSWLVMLAVVAIGALTPLAVAVLLLGPGAVGAWLEHWRPDIWPF